MDIGTLDLVVTGHAWCDTCALPSRLIGTLYLLNAGGVSEAGTFNTCTEDCS